MRKFTKEEFEKGYVEMGSINLSISKNCFMVEDDAMKLGDAYYEEMDTEKRKIDTE